MSSDNSAQKWVIGCLIAGFVAVLLCGGLVAGVGLLGYRAARQIAQEAMPVVQEYAELMAFAQAWTPPSADANGDSLFPNTIGPWSLAGENETAAIPELAIARNGWHGTYESSGTKIDVYVYQVPAGEQNQVFQEAGQAIDRAGYSSRNKSDVTLDPVRVQTFSFQPPERHGRMWWAKDWLVVTITENPGVDLKDFERTYLTAIGGPPAAISAQPVPADQSTSEAAQPDTNAVPSEPAPAEPATTDPDPAPADPSSSDARTESPSDTPGDDGATPAESVPAKPAASESDTAPAAPNPESDASGSDSTPLSESPQG
ncbi:MAG: hypothetical protein U0992_01665 [Planctomycetaceae bacterium]